MAARLKTVRGQLTQKDFSKKISVSQSSYSLYEQGQRVPDALILNRICDSFDIDPGWLLSGRGNMHSDSEGVGKMADMSAISRQESSQPVENKEDEKNKMADVSAMTAQGVSQGKEESLDTKTADTSAIFCDSSRQPIENIDSAEYKNANMSAVLPQELTSRCLRLADENAALLRENGDLRVEVERLKNQLNQAKEARPNDDALLAKLVQENKDLRARLKRFERAGLVVPPLTDIAQNGLPERK